MKQKIKISPKFRGFTIIELLVVISIMGLFATVVLVNYNQLRAERSKKIARHELATNIRKTQSYTLSGRLSNTGVPVRFYIIKLTANSDSYEIQSIDNTAPSTAEPVTVETLNYPDFTPLKELWLSMPDEDDANVACAQIAFSLPFGKTYIDPDCQFEELINNPGALLAIQDAKLHILFDPYIDEVPEVQVNGIVGSVKEGMYSQEGG